MEELKIWTFSLSSILASMFLTQIETVLSIAVLITALIYNIRKLLNKKNN